MHFDIAKVLFEILIILSFAKVGAYLFERIKQPPVLGELVVGIIIGNIAWMTGGAFDVFIFFRTDEFIHILSEIGVIILLFEIGLQSEIGEMLKCGWPSARVAIVGVVLPFALGFFLTKWLGISDDFNVALFLGATLTATSVGITARVLKDMGKLETDESRVILGAAVIDDVLGLIVLAIVSGIVSMDTSAGIDKVALFQDIVIISFKAFAFLIGAIVLGRWTAPTAMRIIKKVEVRGVKLTVAIATAFLFALIAEEMGLAPIIGAFAAGLILDDIHFEGFNEKRRLEEMLGPLSDFLVPIFFVVIGMSVNLEMLMDMNVLWMGGILTLVAIVGKFVAGFAAMPRKMNYIAIGIGMVPRGEVGLIFAAVGKRLGVVNDQLFAIVVMLVMVTTLMTPPLLGISMNGFRRKKSSKS